MDEIDKDYIIEQAMVSVASFAAAGRMAKSALEKGGVAHNGMNAEEVLKYLIDFMEKESDKTFEEYDKSFKKKVSRSTTYIDLIPEAPFNPEDKKGTMETLRDMCKDEKFHLVYVLDEKNNPKFVTLEEFERNYYHYWEILLKSWGQSDEEIEKFKQGIHI